MDKMLQDVEEIVKEAQKCCDDRHHVIRGGKIDRWCGALTKSLNEPEISIELRKKGKGLITVLENYKRQKSSVPPKHLLGMANAVLAAMG